jgi:hypothetical protein
LNEAPRLLIGLDIAVYASAPGSSSPTWHGRSSASSRSSTSVVRRSSASRKARARSSGRGCHAVPFAANAVRLQLHALAYNVGNFMRTLAMPKTAEPWSLISLREKLIKIVARVVSHGRYVTFQLAEVAVSRQMFKDALILIARLRRRPHQREGRCDRMRQTTMAEVRPDEGKSNELSSTPRESGNISSAAHDTGRGRSFLPRTPENQTMALAGPKSEECRLETFRV